MELLTKEMRQSLPPIYSTDGLGDEVQAVAKFFTPDSNWTWYVFEGGPVIDDLKREVDYHFFGLVDGHEREIGYFSLNELKEVTGPMGLRIERDLYWKPKTLKEIKEARY